ncbi:MAG: hypothetical protein HC882_09730 [Acidobacteria bacterium]|nr:hypothetical protein [Acidobacteriota bacterium]
MGQQRGRHFFTPLVAEYERVAENESLRGFAKRRNISDKSLSYWRSKLRREREEQEQATAPTFIPVVVRPAEKVTSVVSLRLGATTLMIHDPARTPPEWLAAVVVAFSQVRS